MRLVCLSDTHGEQDRFKVPDGDVLVHAGDFSGLGTEREIHKFAKWLSSIPQSATRSKMESNPFHRCAAEDGVPVQGHAIEDRSAGALQFKVTMPRDGSKPVR